MSRFASAASAVALMLMCPAAAGASAAAWSVQRTPNPRGAQNSVLSSVSCSSPRVCVAVGHYTSSRGAGTSLAERWDGTTWSIEPTPRPTGARTTLLFGVSCVSRVCVAVGSATDPAGVTMPLAERWNGRRWSIQKTPNLRARRASTSYLGRVSCLSASFCIAVGYSGTSDGTRGQTLAERWNGATWAVQRTSNPAGATASFLSGVSCISPRSCIAVGFFNDQGGGHTLAERWNRAVWSIQRTPTPQAAAAVQLVGVSCRFPSACMAAGFFTIVTGIEIMLAERSRGAGWSIEHTLYPPGATGVRFSDVACASDRSCTAVGFFGDVAGVNEPLAEHWDGSTWAVQQTPHPAGAISTALGSVSCPSPAMCTAIGSYTNRAGTEVTLAERYPSP